MSTKMDIYKIDGGVKWRKERGLIRKSLYL